MKTYERAGPSSDNARAHPWTEAEGDPRYRYRDFKAEPRLIRTSLEDFAPWNGWEAMETFYGLIEWLNGPDCILESNDSAFNGPDGNENPEFQKALECSGRVMALYRRLPLNLSRSNVERLAHILHRNLAQMDPRFQWGAIGTTIMKARYVNLPMPEEAQVGYQLMLSFWAWGDDEAETMSHLNRVFKNLWKALRDVLPEIAESNKNG
jgi:hypothetical protein